jgi:hypothetical protein
MMEHSLIMITPKLMDWKVACYISVTNKGRNLYEQVRMNSIIQTNTELSEMGRKPKGRE